MPGTQGRRAAIAFVTWVARPGYGVYVARLKIHWIPFVAVSIQQSAISHSPVRRRRETRRAE